MNQATVDTKLQQLVDRSEITDLVSRLGWCLDEGRFDEMRSLLVEEATVRTPGGLAEGRDAVVAQASRNHTPDDHIQHVITNVVADVDGDRATVRANLMVHFAPLVDTPEPAIAPAPRSVVGEVYQFEVVHTSEGWRFSRIEAVPVWMSGSRTPNPPPSSGARSA
jgi:hypothetical protein